MKNLCILDWNGNVRPGKATVEAIDDILGGGGGGDRLATVKLDDGALVATPLTERELEALRGEMGKRRRDALATALDLLLAAARACEGIRGVSLWNLSLNLDVGEAPWAEDVARLWADENDMHVADEPMPSKPGKWNRRAEIRIGADSWKPAIATLRWPEVNLTAAEIVARDADEAGMPDEAMKIRAEDKIAVEDF
jgi:hypothetical protein